MLKKKISISILALLVAINTNKIFASSKFGWLKDNEEWYYLNETGEIQLDWKLIDDKWYYFDSNGKMQTGWLNDKGIWYYLNETGEMQLNWKLIDGKWYYFDLSGQMKTGWLKDKGIWYYLNQTGEMQLNWKLIDDKWYYFDSNGQMQTGWLNDKGIWYYLNETGEMQLNWKLIDGKWYYFDLNGQMQTGWLEDKGLWYHLDQNGEMLSNTKVGEWDIDTNGIATLFTYSSIPENIKRKMSGNSLPVGVEIGFDDLSYLQLTYYGFDNKTHTGEMVVSNKIAKEVVDIFKELYEKRYPIEKMKLIDDYNANDNLSMQDNNSSSFCYRKIAGSNKLSNHSKGLAIDINPIQNPHVKGSSISPIEGKEYTDRTNIRKGMIVKGDACYEAFTKRGWKWGGTWNNPDYQHFEKNI